jgi:tetraacyldisaccharide 4'-kinase
MNLLKEKMVAIMQQDSESRAFFSFETLSRGLSLAYGAGLALRQAAWQNGLLPQYRLPCRVISIGNLTTGGTGKTPMTIKTAKLLQQAGWKVVVISRGYRGTAERTGGVVSDGRQLLMGPESAGDEPVMLARALPFVPVLVGADRYQAGQRAIRRFSPDVILLDDAFQHRRLYRDLDLVLLDSEKPFGNGYVLPRGILRESISALERADAVILTRCQEHPASWPDIVAKAPGRGLPGILKGHPGDIPVFTSRHVPLGCRIINGLQNTDGARPLLHGRRVHAFSGIARNDTFFNMLKTFQPRRLSVQAFQDHHAYTDRDLRKIEARARANHADLVVTTEKDYTRVAGRLAFPVDLMVIGVEIELLEGDALFREFLHRKIH